MANLTFSEKQLIETVFGMSGGYVLNFSNREFEEFMKDVVSYNIYAKYPGLSKAKMLRSYIQDESDIYVGKVIIMLLNYMRDNNLISDDIKEKADKLYEFGKTKLGKKNDINRQSAQPKIHSEINYSALNTSLLDIEKYDTQQAKGYAFEKYINTLFNNFNLEPRASYRTEFDQIDGSFTFNGNTILVEAKYKRNEIPKNDLILFSNKIETKSPFAKGLFISYSPIEEKAIEYYANRSARITILTVAELFIMCEHNYPLPTVLQKKFRALDETGCIFKHIMQLM